MFFLNMGQPILISSFYMRLTTHKLESNCTFPYLTKFASSPGASRQQEGVLGRCHWCLTGSSANENAIDAVNLRHDVRFADHEWLSRAVTLRWLKAKRRKVTIVQEWMCQEWMCQRIKESTIVVIAIGTMLSKAKEYDKFWNKANSNYELRINIAKLLQEKFEIENWNRNKNARRGNRTHVLDVTGSEKWELRGGLLTIELRITPPVW